MSSIKLLAPENTIVYQRILQQLQDKPTNSFQAFEENIAEFGDCRYQILLTEDGSFKLSFQLPELEQQFSQQLLSKKAVNNVGLFFKGIAILSPVPEKGYHLTLKVDLKLLSRLTPSQQNVWAKSLASIRLLLIGQPLRYYFTALANGSAAAASGSASVPTAHMFSSQPGHRYSVQPADDGLSVTVQLPIRFATRQEAAFGTALLQEFCHARGVAGLSQAPLCRYVPPPPAATERRLESNSESSSGAEGGVVSFTFQPRHVTGPQLETVVWSMCTFPQFFNYQLNETKVAVRTLMRASAERMTARLAAAASTRGYDPFTINISQRSDRDGRADSDACPS